MDRAGTTTSLNAATRTPSARERFIQRFNTSAELLIPEGDIPTVDGTDVFSQPSAPATGFHAEQLKLYQSFVDKLKSVGEKGCCVCEELVPTDEVMDVPELPRANLLHRGNDDVEGHHCVNDLVIDHTSVTFAADGTTVASYAVCTSCHRSLTKGRLPANAIKNGLCFGAIPPELAELTPIEQALCSPRRVKINIITLKAVGGVSARAVKGNGSIFTQNVQSIIDLVLPLSIEDALEEFMVTFYGHTQPTKEQLRKLFKVSRVRVSRALRRLLLHPRGEYVNCRLSEERLEALPADDVPDQVIAHIWRADEDGDETINESIAATHDGYAADPEVEILADNAGNLEMLEETLLINHAGFVDVGGNDISNSTVEEAAWLNVLNNIVAGEQARPGQLHPDTTATLRRMGVPHSASIHSQFTLNYFAEAFRFLFPYLRGDPNAPRPVPLSLARFVQHIYRLKDPRFRHNHAFLFLIFNVMQRNEILLKTSLKAKRGQLDRTQALLNSASAQDIVNVIKSIENPRAPVSADVKQRVDTLRRSVTANATLLPGTPDYKLKMRREIFSTMVRHGFPLFWITVNPADLHNPVFLQLAATDEGFLNRFTSLNAVDTRSQLQATCANPFRAAQLFNKTVEAFTAYLLPTLGKIADYYGVVEAQGRGTLHIHMLVWVAGFQGVTGFVDRLQNEPGFQENFLRYITQAVRASLPASSVEEGNTDDDDLMDASPAASSSSSTSSSSFSSSSSSAASSSTHNTLDTVTTRQQQQPTLAAAALQQQQPVEPAARLERSFPPDLGALTNQQLADQVLTMLNSSMKHKTTHTATCFKGNSKECRLDFPRKLVNATTVNATTAQLQLMRDDPWLVEYNSLFLLGLRCNHNIRCILENHLPLAFAYYMTAYATKTEWKPRDIYDILATSVLRYKDPADSRLSADAAKRALQSLNSLQVQVRRHTQFSAPEAINYVMDWPDHYAMQRHQHLPQLALNHYVAQIDSEDEVLLQPQTGNTGFIFSSSVSDYIYRPRELDDACTYIFTACTKKIKINEQHDPDPGSEDTDEVQRISFLREHPQVTTHTIAIRQQPATPTLSFTPMPRDENDELYARDMLVLFKPFRKPANLKSTHATWTAAWNNYEPTVASHPILKHILGNIKELHRGVTQRRAAENERLRTEQENEENALADNTADPTLHDNDEDDNIGGNTDENGIYDDPANPFPQLATNGLVMGDNLSYQILNGGPIDPFAVEAMQQLFPAAATAVSGPSTVTFMSAQAPPLPPLPRQTLELPASRLKSIMKGFADDVDNAMDGAPPLLPEQQVLPVDREGHTVQVHRDDRDILLQDAPPAVLLNDDNDDDDDDDDNEVSSGNPHSPRADRATVSGNITINSVLASIRPPLNRLQTMAFKRVARHLHQRSSGLHPAPLRMHLGGPGGTGKSQVIKGIRRLCNALGHQNLVRTMAYVGSAASAIGGRTIHSTLGLSPKKSMQKRPSDKLQRRFRYSPYLIFDEVSFVDAAFLSDVSETLSTSLDPQADFGGVNVVTTGDMYQLPPVSGKPLYGAPKPQDSTRTTNGLTLWQRQPYKTVILSENMRQAGDTQLQEIVAEVRNGKLSQRNAALLVDRTPSSDPVRSSQATLISYRNSVIDAYNLQQARAAARASDANTTLFIVEAEHTIRGNISPDDAHAVKKALTFLQKNDADSMPPFCPLVHGMPCVFTKNAAVALGVSNGAEATFVRAIPHPQEIPPPQGMEMYVYRHLPLALVFAIPGATFQAPIQGLNPGEILLFPQKVSLSFSYRSSTGAVIETTGQRHTFPFVPAYALTIYKAQGKTFRNVILDMRRGKLPANYVYVGISRAQDLSGLFFLFDDDLLPSQVQSLFAKKVGFDLLVDAARLQTYSDLDEQEFAIDEGIDDAPFPRLQTILKNIEILPHQTQAR